MRKTLFALYSLLFAFCISSAYAIQDAWDHPDSNMARGSIRPGYAQLTWGPGTVLPIKLRNGMMTMINLPPGEAIEDGWVGNDELFDIDVQKGSRNMRITPKQGNQGNDTNMIIMGKSGNKYLFYLRSEPSNASEITYTLVDVVLDRNSQLPTTFASAGQAGAGGGMNSILPRRGGGGSGVFSPDGEDYGWIKTMKIDPSEFRFDLDIFVPNPDDFVIAPERVWRDRIFTYIDFGDKVIAMTQRPVVSILIEGGESPVGFRTDGEHGRLLIVEAVGDMVLRSGQRIVCIKRRSQPFLIADPTSVMALAEANVMRSMHSNQSLHNVGYMGMPMPMGGGMMQGGFFDPGMQMMPMMMAPPAPTFNNAGMNMMPQERNTAGSFLPQSNIPLITSNQQGVAVELRSDPSVKALNDYWVRLMASFSGAEGEGLLDPYRNRVFFAVDEQGVGDLGTGGSSARLYRLRVGPMANIDEAQNLCNQLQRFQSIPCHVVRIQ